MADRTGDLLPRVERAPSEWAWIGCAGVAAVLFCVPLFAMAAGAEELGFALWFHSFYVAVLAVVLFLVRKYGTRHARGLAVIAHSLGLSFSARLRQRDLEPFGSFLLFQMGVTPPRHAAGNGMRGTLDGHELFLFQYRFNQHRPDQTVVILPGAAGLPDFHLSPRRGYWNERDPEWAERFGAGSLIRLPSGAFGDAYVLVSRAPGWAAEAAVSGLFGPAVRDYFAASPGWTVEAAGGRLLVYREGEVKVPDGCPPLMLKAIDVLEVLLEASR
jgi:hypothetical protein